jgi:hypothetical protein
MGFRKRLEMSRIFLATLRAFCCIIAMERVRTEPTLHCSRMGEDALQTKRTQEAG